MIDETGTIVGLMLSPIERFPESDAKQTVTVFRVPFGKWYVFWGGENVTDNYHYAEESQRYAIDVIKTENAMSYEGDPAKNESYFAFGEEILAGARGRWWVSRITSGTMSLWVRPTKQSPSVTMSSSIMDIQNIAYTRI